MTDYSTALEFAFEVARLGGRIALSHFGRSPDARRKADGTWVSEADWAVESQIRLRIARAWPDHNVLGEEEGLTAAGGGEATLGAPTWVIDPIDGTNNYLAGIPIWSTLVGLRIDKESVVGVAHAPALEETYDAALGLGARMNDETISVDPVDKLENATFVFADPREFLERGLTTAFDVLCTRTFRSRGFGDFWGHMLVARGAAHIMLEPHLSVWDVAALQPIVSEAGGKVTDFAGRPWADAGDCMTTNGVLHDEVVALLDQRD